jgi:phospholipid transport system substrate-binding protein
MIRNAVRPAALLCAVLSTLLGGCTSTTPDEPEPVPSNPAILVVERLHAAVIEVMKEGPELGYHGRFARLEEIARGTYDIPYMAMRTLGTSWRELAPSQRKIWLDRYERFHISAVADFRDRYRGQVYRTLGSKELPDGTMKVHTILDYPGRNVDLYTDYLMRRRPSGWRIVDRLAPPSVSDVAMQRAEYATVLQERGFDALIETMDQRIARREEQQ